MLSLETAPPPAVSQGAVSSILEICALLHLIIPSFYVFYNHFCYASVSGDLDPDVVHSVSDLKLK